MNVKEAVSAAKGSIAELFADQIYSDPLLEEVEFDDNAGAWLITIGFLRMPEVSKHETALVQEGALSRGLGLGAGPFGIPRRAYKVVRINDGSRTVVSVKDREPA